MFDSDVNGIETNEVMGSVAAGTMASTIDWREIDRQLRTIAKKRAALDADEVRWVREAERVQIWKRDRPQLDARVSRERLRVHAEDGETTGCVSRVGSRRCHC